MRRKPMKTGTIALILTGIYTAGLIFGVWLISYMPSGMKRTRMTAMTQTFAEQYIESGQFNDAPLSGAATLIYDADGQLLETLKRSERIYFDFAQRAQNDLPKVLSGKEILRLVLFARDNTTLGYTSLMYIGVPIVTDGEITGAFIWFRELRDLLESVLGFACVYTAAFASVTFFMLLNLRTQRRYELMRRHYIDNITHELKTPVASIKALAEALSDGMEKSPNDRSVYYGMILREANRQERMICEVLELSKLQSYRVPMDRRSVAAADVFDGVLDKYATLCDLMGVTFTVDDSIKTLPTLYTDVKYIRVVLDALLSNAIKFVPEDGGAVRISAKLSRGRASICIADNGKGISRQELPYIFERFYKGCRSDNEAGSGLGLAIAKEITDNLKEKLWIHSEEGAGTQAWFTISLKK